MPVKTDVFRLSFTGNVEAFKRYAMTITYSDLVGNVESRTSVQLPYTVIIEDIIPDSAPTPDSFVIIDKNNGQKQFASSNLSTLVVVTGRPRQDAFKMYDRKLLIRIEPNEVLKIYLVPLGNATNYSVSATLRVTIVW